MSAGPGRGTPRTRSEARADPAPAAAPASEPEGTLARALEELLSRSGAAPRIVGVERTSSPYRSSHALEEVTARFADGRTLALILKASGTATRAERAGPRPAFTADPDRERWTYDVVLPRLGLDAPRCYGILAEGTAAERLVLERVEGTPLTEIGDVAAWSEAARWLARLHGMGRDLVARVGAAAEPIRQGPVLQRRWLSRARRHAERRGRAGDRRILDEIGPAYERAIETLSRSPATLLHGEFYASNVLVRRDGGVVPVDWETTAIGPAALDLAALVAGRWDAPRRAAIVRAYREARAPGSGPDTPLEERLACARLVIAVQWLGWSGEWRPPPEHAQDWLGEAARCAERIGP